jgi:hypothetical protein
MEVLIFIYNIYLNTYAMKNQLFLKKICISSALVQRELKFKDAGVLVAFLYKPQGIFLLLCASLQELLFFVNLKKNFLIQI